MDPTDPKEDLAKLRAQAGGDAPAPAPKVDYIAESAEVPEGSLQMDRDYSINDFAALAGVVTEKQKMGSAGQAKGKDPMPSTSKPSTRGEQPHPLKDKLVGEASPDEEDKFHTDLDDLVHKTFGHSSDEEKSDKDRIAELEKRVEALEAMLKGKNEDAPPGREKQVKALKKKFDDPGAPYAIAWSQHNKHGKPKNRSTQTASVDTSDIKNRLYDALNKKMGL
jgi:hypothetical protein